MGFRNGGIAKVWEVQPGKGNYTRVRMSTDRKNEQTGQYEQDWSGFANFVGAAHADASKLTARGRIKLGKVGVTSRYDKERKKEYINYTVFSFEAMDASGSKTAAPKEVESNPVEGDEPPMPF